MNRNWKTAVIFLLFLTISACIPTDVEPEATEPNQTPTLPPLPTPFPPPEQLIDTAVSPTPISLSLLLPPDAVPETLPAYAMELGIIPAGRDTALAWAQAFGLANAEVVDETDEMIRVLSRDEAAGTYEELTFLRTPFEQVIVYSGGIDWQNPNGPTPTPPGETPSPMLSPEMVTSMALDFVRNHNLLPEPLIAHEFPSYDDHYLVQVITALSGLRLTGIGETPGTMVRISGDGRVNEARIVPANFTAVDTVTVQPLDQIYPAFLQGAAQNTYFNERAQLGGIDVSDPMRFQAHSLPYGNQGDRVELVYAALPLQPERIVPMWLITRPDDQAWDHYLEYYLLATVGESAPRPMPTMTPLAHTDIVPESLRIIPPLIVDGENGRLYTNAAVDGITRTVSLDAATGNLLAAFGLTGDLALDAGRNLLYVDKYPHGLTVIDTMTNEPLNDIQIPTGERSHAQLHADPASGNVLLFRDQMLLVADPLSETWQQTTLFTVEGSVCDEPMEPPSTITQTWFDEDARLLYVTLADYVCTPWHSYTVIVYDVETMSEVARHPGVYYLSGVAVNGRFYGKYWFRLGKTFQWAWQEGQPWLAESDRGEDFVGGFSGFQVDEGRGWLYEMTVNGLQVLDTETMAVVQTVPAPIDGRLVGFDPVLDNLYFVGGDDDRLHVWPVRELLP